MSNQSVGYIRVSSIDQNPERQLQGIHLDKKFTDFVSAVSLNRPNLQACIDYVREGDTLYIDSIDRLARNLRNLQKILDTLTNKGVKVKFVKENLLFNGNSDPISTLMLQMMGAFSEFERNMIRSRQREGIELAKKKGKPLGRKPSITKTQEQDTLILKESGLSIRQIAIKMQVSRATIYKILEKNK